MQQILPDCTKLEYSGRIDFSNPMEPLMVYPASYVKMRFTGNKIGFRVKNQQMYWDNYVGYIIDGSQGKRLLPLEGETELEITLPDNGDDLAEHEIMVFKRMDACHVMSFLGFFIADYGKVLDLPEKPLRKIEVYGDSVSAGEVSEAVEYTGKEDPEHNGEYSNSWYSYAWMTARKLGANLHNIAQGGAALMSKTGWFLEPDAMGMEEIYDKITYHPGFGKAKAWDFSLYRPQVVIVAIGQNDNHPVDFMAEDFEGEMAVKWKKHYQQFVRRLRTVYPKATIILSTTLLQHEKAWDNAIAEVCRELNDENIHHFLYKRNGTATPGHIRIGEAEEMAEELATFIESLGEQIWEITDV